MTDNNTKDTRFKTVGELKECEDVNLLDRKQYNTWKKIHDEEENDIEIDNWNKEVIEIVGTKPDKSEQIKAAKKKYYEANKERNKEVSRLSSKLYYWRNKLKKDPENLEKYQKMIDEITALLGEARTRRAQNKIEETKVEETPKEEDKVEEETKIIDEEVISLSEQQDEKDPESQ